MNWKRNGGEFSGSSYNVTDPCELIEELFVRKRKRIGYRDNLFGFGAKLSIRENGEDGCYHVRV
jgi:hypothetical protein